MHIGYSAEPCDVSGVNDDNDINDDDDDDDDNNNNNNNAMLRDSSIFFVTEPFSSKSRQCQDKINECCQGHKENRCAFIHN